MTGSPISGTYSGNYIAHTSSPATTHITPRTLLVRATADNKGYDGTTAAVAHLGDDRVSGDVFTDSYTSATFGNKNVANGKTVTVTGISISGTDAGNYIANTSTTATADITPRALLVRATGDNKGYDGTTAAVAHLSDDRVSGDVFTASYTSASFADKNVGNDKTVTVTGISISGTDAGNYTANTSTTATADITPRALLV